jgi:hypothetical protein
MSFSLGILTWLEIIFYGLGSHLRFNCKVEIGFRIINFSHIKCCFTIYLHLQFEEAINKFGHAFEEGKLLFSQCRLLYVFYNMTPFLCINYEIVLPVKQAFLRQPSNDLSLVFWTWRTSSNLVFFFDWSPYIMCLGFIVLYNYFYEYQFK